LASLGAGIRVFLFCVDKDVDGRAFASPKGFGRAGGSSPAMTNAGLAASLNRLIYLHLLSFDQLILTL
jgi:hypothetical protein